MSSTRRFLTRSFASSDCYKNFLFKLMRWTSVARPLPTPSKGFAGNSRRAMNAGKASPSTAHPECGRKSSQFPANPATNPAMLANCRLSIEINTDCKTAPFCARLNPHCQALESATKRGQPDSFPVYWAWHANRFCCVTRENFPKPRTRLDMHNISPGCPACCAAC